MEAMQAMLTRRSVRNFINQPVSPEDIEKMLRAGMQAPSASNRQPWRFVVVDQRDLLDNIPLFHPWSKMLLEATLAIVVCAEVPPDHKYEMWVQDCAACSQNILLAAHALGLGGVWLGVHPREEHINGVRDLFDLPENIKPFSILALGHPVKLPEPVDRFDPTKIHSNKW